MWSTRTITRSLPNPSTIPELDRSRPLPAPAAPCISERRGGLGALGPIMINALRLVAQVLVGIALLEMALGAFQPLVTLQLEHRSIDTQLIGLIGSAYFAGFVVGTLTCFAIIDRVGH